MKKLSDEYSEVRDLLLQLMFGIEPLVPDVRDWGYKPYVGRSSHNYQRDMEVKKGCFIISFNGIIMGKITRKPHKILVLKRQQGKMRLYRNVLEKAARDYIPDIKITYKSYV